MKTPKLPPPPQNDFQDSELLREYSLSLRQLVRQAAARLKQARLTPDIDRIASGFGKGNGERFQISRY